MESTQGLPNVVTSKNIYNTSVLYSHNKEKAHLFNYN